MFYESYQESSDCTLLPSRKPRAISELHLCAVALLRWARAVLERMLLRFGIVWLMRFAILFAQFPGGFVCRDFRGPALRLVLFQFHLCIEITSARIAAKLVRSWTGGSWHNLSFLTTLATYAR